jgi:hypothetical protein
MALKPGMLVASSLLEDEVTRLCGRRHERQPHRTPTLYGHQRVRARVTCRRDGAMRRWCAAGLLRAESRSRRAEGHRAMPTLIKALEESAQHDGLESSAAARENDRGNHLPS